MVHGVVLAAQPANLERLVVVVVMRFRFCVAALLTRLRHKPTAFYHATDNHMRGALLTKIRIVAKFPSALARGFAKIPAPFFQFFRVVLDRLIPSFSIARTLANTANALPSAWTGGRLVEVGDRFVFGTFWANFMCGAIFPYRLKMFFFRLCSFGAPPFFKANSGTGSALVEKPVTAFLIWAEISNRQGLPA